MTHPASAARPTRPQTAGTADDGPLRIVRRPWTSKTSGLWSTDLALSMAFCFVVFYAAVALLLALGALVWPVPQAWLRGAPPSLALLGLLLLLLWYRRLLARLYDAQWRSTRLRGGYTINNPWPEAPLVSGILKSQLLREGNPTMAIPSVPPTPEQALHFNWAKWPISFPRAIRSWLVTVPWTALRMVVNKLTRGTYASAISDDDVIRFVEGTSSCVFSELLEDGRTLRLVLPERLPLATWHGRRIAGFEIRMDIEARKITRCTLEGRSLLGDNDLIFGIVILAMTHYQHTKSHLMAEQATLEIERRGVRALAPSARFTVALHDGLMNATQSPLGGEKAPLTATGVDKDSVTASMPYHLAHFIDERKNRIRFYRFLAQGRLETIALLHKHAIAVSPEAAFNNMVLHPVDHDQGMRLMRRHIWSMDMSRSFTSYLRSCFFADVIAGPLTNPMVTERLSDLDPVAHPFYAELYEKLHAIDAEYADQALTSCSF